MDLAYDIFVQIIKGLITKCIPFKKVTVRDSDPWFVTPLVKSLLRKRNYLYHRGRTAQADTLSQKIGRIVAEVRSDKFSNIDSKDSNKLWQMIKSNTNYNSRCKIDALGIKTNDVVEIGHINAFFTNVATDPTYDVDNVRNIVNSYRCSHSTQNTNDISEYEIAMRLNKLKKLLLDPMTYLTGSSRNVHSSYPQS